MGVDQTSLDRIRNATFPSARRGYDKHEVEKFLARLADWLETGGGDASRSDTVKRELERVGQRTGAILAQAEESAQQIRAEGEEEARGTINSANAEAGQARTEADTYSQETRSAADAYGEETRRNADEKAAAIRAEAEEEARETIVSAQAQAGRIVHEGTQRREDIEAVIGDLVRRRDDVLTETEGLAGTLEEAVREYRPSGPDPSAAPEEFDPLEREGEETEADETEDEDAEPEDEDAEPEDEDVEQRRRAGRVQT
jgi:DivIVA domain-containing protein